MKKIRCIWVGLIFLIWIPSSGFCETMDEMIHQFGQEFDALKPPPNSSVNADYKLEQAALGTFYTTRAINKLYDQNTEILSKTNEMLLKYNEMIEQNKEIIKLLTIIANPKKDEPPSGSKNEERQ